MEKYLIKTFNAHNGPFGLQMNALKKFNDVFGGEFWKDGTYFYKDQKVTAYVHKDDLERIRQEFLKKINQDQDFINTYFPKAFSIIDDLKSKYLSLVIEVERLDSEEGIKDWLKKFYEYASDVTAHAYITDGIALDNEYWLKYFNQTSEEFSKKVFPLEPSFTKRFEYEVALLKLERSKYTKEDFVRNFSWIENSYSNFNLFDLKSLEAKLNKIQKEEAEEIVSSFESHQEIRVDVSELITPEQKINYLLSKAIDLQDARKEEIYRANSILDLAYKKLLSFYKFDKETEKVILQSAYFTWFTDFSKEELLEQSKKANEGFWWTFRDFKYGVDAEKENLSVTESINKSLGNEVKGFVANTGVATGRVVIINSALDFGKVLDGDVIVTSMTRPEMMPILPRASAFVTDEGGITSHAAIVARELKKPCIIGTKNATRILKDGDIVEVDANKGIVRII